MFQARLPQGNLLKKLVDAIKDLVTEANFDVSAEGVQLQAMDTAHVCLLALKLRADGFEEYRWDCFCGARARVWGGGGGGGGGGGRSSERAHVFRCTCDR
jgi:hypothetical protein